MCKMVSIRSFTGRKMAYTTKRFDPKSEWLYRGYFPVIPNKKDHKDAWGRW